jgi:PadR family transcriptional regulator, regulatory protein PadR
MHDTEPHRKKFSRELATGTMALVLMTVLGRASEPLYGYQIAKQLDSYGAGVAGGKQSAIYPVLRNLCGAGLLDSHVEPSISGPPRRYYRITPLGSEVLAEWLAIWADTRNFVDTVLSPPAT